MPSDGTALAALNLVRTPVWVFDIDRRRVHWANQAALQVWRATSLDELCSRDMGRDMSAAVATRLAQYQADFARHDARFNEQWTLYPGGRPVALNVTFRGHRLADGRMRVQIEGAEMRHYPDTDTLEIENPRIRAIDTAGRVTRASALRALTAVGATR